MNARILGRIFVRLIIFDHSNSRLNDPSSIQYARIHNSIEVVPWISVGCAPESRASADTRG